MTDNLEYWLEYYGMPKENISNCADIIRQGYGANRYLEGLQTGAEADFRSEEEKEGCKE